MIVPPIGIGPLGAGEWRIGGAPNLGASVTPPGGGVAVPPGGSGSTGFAGALTDAIGALSNGQEGAARAAQQLATGQATSPVQAIQAVENASLAVDFASQVRNQLDTAATTLFQTQL